MDDDAHDAAWLVSISSPRTGQASAGGVTGHRATGGASSEAASILNISESALSAQPDGTSKGWALLRASLWKILMIPFAILAVASIGRNASGKAGGVAAVAAVIVGIATLASVFESLVLFGRGIGFLGRKADGSAKPASVGYGLGWMLLLPVLFFFLPVLGPFLGGLVGGRRAGGVGGALIAAALPALVLSVTAYSLLEFLELTRASTAIGTMVFFGMIGGAGPTILGAIVGGMYANPVTSADEERGIAELGL